MKSSWSQASRNTSSFSRRRYSIIGRPPSSASHSCMECVAPTLADGLAVLTAGRASRWPAISPSIARSHDSGVVRPGRPAEGPEVPAERHDPRLVDRAVPVDPVTERPDHGLAVAGEAGRRAGVQPPPAGREPAGEGEVVQRHHRRQAGLAHRVGHPPVVVELALRDDALLGLDPRPLDRVPVGVQPKAGQHRDVGRGSAGSGRTRGRSGPRRGCPDAAPSPTSRWRCCRPRPGGPPWPRPTGTTAGRRGRSSVEARRGGRGWPRRQRCRCCAATKLRPCSVRARAVWLVASTLSVKSSARASQSPLAMTSDLSRK